MLGLAYYTELRKKTFKSSSSFGMVKLWVRGGFIQSNCIFFCYKCKESVMYSRYKLFGLFLSTVDSFIWGKILFIINTEKKRKLKARNWIYVFLCVVKIHLPRIRLGMGNEVLMLQLLRSIFCCWYITLSQNIKSLENHFELSQKKHILISQTGNQGNFPNYVVNFPNNFWHFISF